MSMEIEAWHLWLLGGMILAALEMLGLAFVALALGTSCVAGAIAALMGASLTVQIGASTVTAIILTPLFVRWFKQLKPATDAVALAGESGSSGQRCILVEQQGRLGVVIKGDFFPAASDSDISANGTVFKQPLAVGMTVQVLRFSGITVIVQPLSTDDKE